MSGSVRPSCKFLEWRLSNTKRHATALPSNILKPKSARERPWRLQTFVQRPQDLRAAPYGAWATFLGEASAPAAAAALNAARIRAVNGSLASGSLRGLEELELLEAFYMPLGCCPEESEARRFLLAILSR